MRTLQRRHGRVSAALLLLMAQASFATDYYVNPNSIGDSNFGTSRSLPWKTLDKVNSFSFAQGDRVFFFKGGAWEGTLKVQSGVSYGSYPSDSTAAAPVIRAASNVGKLSWSLYRGKIYVADVTSVLKGGEDIEGVKYPAVITQLSYNNLRLQRARYPNVNGLVGAANAGVFGWGKNRFLRMAKGTPVRDDSTVQTMLIESGALPLGLAASDLEGAQVLAKNWPWYLTRYNLTAVQAGQTGFALSADPTWPGAKAFRLSEGNGYWLENKLWMLDKPGEWVFFNGKLYVWLPDDASPAGKSLYASTRVHAIEGRGAKSVSISDLVAADSMGDAIAITGATTSVTIKNVGAWRAGAMGIKVINNGSGSGSISGSTVSDSAGTAIYLGSDSTRNINVINNRIYNAGMGSFAWAAVWLGHASVATGNVIDNSSYIGLRTGKLNRVEDNLITRSCMEFDDCGGIYARGMDYDGRLYGLSYAHDVGGNISQNFVDGAPLSQAPDRVDGLPDVKVNTKTSAVNGIYLDDFAGSVTVSGNYVTGADTGVILHYGRYNTVSNNTLVGNLRTQVFMQENKHGNLISFDDPQYCGGQPNCNATNYMYGNVVSGNLMASSLPNPVMTLTSDFQGVADFARYSGNTYATYGTPTFAYVYPSVPTSKSFGQWVSLSQEGNSTVYATSHGVQQVAGASNMITNGDFAQGFAGWSDYLAASSIAVTGCSEGTACLASYAGSDAKTIEGRKQFIVNTTNPMPVVEGQQLMLTFDALSTQPGDGVVTVLRSTQKPDLYADKTNNGYVPLGTSWQRYSTLLTVKSGGNVRLDFEFYANGNVRVDNVKLVPVQSVTGRAEPVGRYNWGSTAKSFACPVSDMVACTNYMDLHTGQAVSFPLTVRAKSSVVLVSRSPLWLDPDHDGVPGDGVSGGFDRCPWTTDGVSVDSAGCAIGQTPMQ